MSRNREKFHKYEDILMIGVKILRLLPKKFSYGILKLNRSNSSMIGVAINYICVKRLAKYCGKNVAIFSNVYLFGLENLVIGDNVSIHPMCYIDAKGEVEIGNDVSIAHNTSILSQEHLYNDLAINIKDQGMISYKTTICNNVWIGCGCRILAGVNIKSGSIVAAGSVVSKDVDSDSIVGGVPARVIKKRSKIQED